MRIKVLKEWKRYLPTVTSILNDIFKNCKIYVIGSALREAFHAKSDVDLLIICRERPMMREVVTALMKLEDIGIPKIFQLHVGDREDLDRYRSLGEVVPLEELLPPEENLKGRNSASSDKESNG
ncbi:hypothetical protein IPA_02205 [Ignicoccus pacificus DSM 13166]|uniref:Polymerase beta nucleotidyltransferase domain-containing protein n=1 Tax=Ignicoccus pacificus DSM 13166 TaxID=940294 RepID=A0A977KAM6_9CREN|nr:hypothetical protein IPA_02205 [Ignicoccus pacificus DSM 13166]